MNKPENGRTPREHHTDNSTERTERHVFQWLLSRGIPVSDAASLPGVLKDGVLLVDLLKGLDPLLDLTGFNRRVLSRGPALANLEIVLGAVWRKSALGKCMPTAEEIYEGRRERVFSLLRVIMEVYVLRGMCRRNRELLQWIQKVLAPYSIVVPDHVMDADLDSSAGVSVLWSVYTHTHKIKYYIQTHSNITDICPPTGQKPELTTVLCTIGDETNSEN